MASKTEEDAAELITKHVISAISPVLEGISARLKSVEEEFDKLHFLITSSNDTTNNSIREQLAQLSSELKNLTSDASNNGPWAKIVVRNKIEQSARHKTSVDENTVVAVQEAEERRKRQYNIIINGIPEDNSYSEKISSLFEQMKLEKPSDARIKHTFKATRLGKSQNGLPRPIRLTLEPSLKRKVMENAPLLREAENCRNIFIINDLTPAQSREAYLLRKKEREIETANNGKTDGAAITCEDASEEKQREDETANNGKPDDATVTNKVSSEVQRVEVETANNGKTDDAKVTNEESSEEDNVNIIINYSSDDVNSQDAAQNLSTTGASLEPNESVNIIVETVSKGGNYNDGWIHNDTLSGEKYPPGLFMLMGLFVHTEIA